jgi:2-amino-4-hydroxy-6-hydroxymethyldihydropteridine diphosphokinase
MTSRRGFMIGIGSNIEPETNIVQIVEQLLAAFSTLHISRVLQIPPIGMNTHNDFLNLVVLLETEMSEVELKSICNHIEINQGRDRTDPDRKMKDRCADLDILTAISLPEDAEREPADITDEYFLYPLIDELVAYLCGEADSLKQAGEPLHIDDLSFGQSATTINRNTGTRDKRIAQ